MSDLPRKLATVIRGAEAVAWVVYVGVLIVVITTLIARRCGR